MLGEDMVDEVLQAVNTCAIQPGWNGTMILMISNVNSPEM